MRYERDIRRLPARMDLFTILHPARVLEKSSPPSPVCHVLGGWLWWVSGARCVCACAEPAPRRLATTMEERRALFGGQPHSFAQGLRPEKNRESGGI